MACQECLNVRKGPMGLAVGCDAGQNMFIPLATGRCAKFEPKSQPVVLYSDLVKPVKDEESPATGKVAS